MQHRYRSNEARNQRNNLGNFFTAQEHDMHSSVALMYVHVSVSKIPTYSRCSGWYCSGYFNDSKRTGSRWCRRENWFLWTKHFARYYGEESQQSWNILIYDIQCCLQMSLACSLLNYFCASKYHIYSTNFVYKTISSASSLTSSYFFRRYRILCGSCLVCLECLFWIAFQSKHFHPKWIWNTVLVKKLFKCKWADS